MTANALKPASSTAGVATSMATVTHPAEDNSVNELIARIKDKDDKVRGAAWLNADQYGASAVKPLAEVLSATDIEVARAAKRVLWRIVRHAGRPGAANETAAVVAQLTPLLSTATGPVRREVLWMLSEVGGDNAVAAVAALLSDKELREDARCALQRVPGTKATAALKKGLSTAPDDFKPAIAVSLRARGEKVDSYPSQKLVPTKQTTVQRLVT
jgi:HEAT repeat protein